jgi:flagellar export protein fliJ
MAKFKYRMQNILELKMKLEEQQKMDLAAARINLNEEEDKLKELYERKNEYQEALRESCKNKLNVHKIRMSTLAYESMDHVISRQKIEVKKARGKVAIEQDKMGEAMKERKIQEKLRERNFNRFVKEVAYEEAATVDELVAYKYGSDVNSEKWRIDG